MIHLNPCATKPVHKSAIIIVFKGFEIEYLIITRKKIFYICISYKINKKLESDEFIILLKIMKLTCGKAITLLIA